jgi:hypothetical protein
MFVGGFIKSISDREFGNIYNPSAKESQNLSQALNEMASNLKSMTKEDLTLIQSYEYKRNIISGVGIKFKILLKINQSGIMKISKRKSM